MGHWNWVQRQLLRGAVIIIQKIKSRVYLKASLDKKVVSARFFFSLNFSN